MNDPHSSVFWGSGSRDSFRDSAGAVRYRLFMPRTHYITSTEPNSHFYEYLAKVRAGCYKDHRNVVSATIKTVYFLTDATKADVGLVVSIN